MQNSFFEPLLESEETRRLLFTFSRSGDVRLEPICVVAAFEDQVRQTPRAPAVMEGAESISYAKLNRRANQLAHHLRRRGVRADSQVGLYMQRSIDAIVAILGILKSGGSYVPLDPDIGATRLAYQIADIGAPAIVSHRGLAGQLLPHRSKVVDVDRDAAELIAERETDPDPIFVPENLAYVIYTSGSTGLPKGVAITHRSLANYTGFMCDKLGLHQGGQQMRLATVSTLAADLGNTVIFPSLVSGGCLDLIPYEVATDPLRLKAHLAAHPVDVLKIVPSHLTALISASENAAALLPRNQLVIGGEKFSIELWNRLSSLPRTCAILNHYGPTETTVGSLTFGLGGELPSNDCASVPIGRPIANTEIFILDKGLRCVPVGKPGELYIGGEGLARGYLNQPDQTAARFIPHPYSLLGGRRLYRTGDRVRFLPDGQVEFLDRVDCQVKIRGFRVELGEIEAVMRLHPAISEAVVLAQTSASEDSQLIAYYVMHPGAPSPKKSEFRGFLIDRLPSFMIPATFVNLKALPLTLNGKIDRHALAQIESTASQAERTIAAPRTREEECLAAIWAEVLRVDTLSVDDNFFELGGDSILSIQIAAKAARFGLRFTPLDLFRCPTIAALATLITTKFPTEQETSCQPRLRERQQFRATLDSETLDRIRKMVAPD
jgi:amino acid adenylation domain-containing protein